MNNPTAPIPSPVQAKVRCSFPAVDAWTYRPLEALEPECVSVADVAAGANVVGSCPLLDVDVLALEAGRFVKVAFAGSWNPAFVAQATMFSP
jgi:hypothetical protein